MKKLKGSVLLLTCVLLMCLCAGAMAAADTSWYTGDKTEYVITTADQLHGLSKLSADGALADGITFNSPISDCETTLGAAQSSEVDELGNTTYKFKVLNGVIYEIHVDEEGIFGISLNKLNN